LIFGVSAPDKLPEDSLTAKHGLFTEQVSSMIYSTVTREPSEKGFTGCLPLLSWNYFTMDRLKLKNKLSGEHKRKRRGCIWAMDKLGKKLNKFVSFKM
jgi:hypothetical protein